MARQTVQVVLRDNVENLGYSGELVRVKPGYARNYLIPRGLAALATHANVAQIEHEKNMALARTAKLRAAVEAEAAQMNGKEVQIAMQVGENGRLFGSVGAKDIAEAFEKKGIEIDRRKLMLEEPIKEVGDYEVELKFAYDVAAKLKVIVKTAA